MCAEWSLNFSKKFPPRVMTLWGWWSQLVPRWGTVGVFWRMGGVTAGAGAWVTDSRLPASARGPTDLEARNTCWWGTLQVSTAQLRRYMRPTSLRTLNAGRHGEKKDPILQPTGQAVGMRSLPACRDSQTSGFTPRAPRTVGLRRQAARPERGQVAPAGEQGALRGRPCMGLLLPASPLTLSKGDSPLCSGGSHGPPQPGAALHWPLR